MERDTFDDVRAAVASTPSDRISALLAALDAANARLAEAEKLLRSLEWAGRNSLGESSCRWCGMLEIGDEHFKHCRLARFLKETPRE